MIGVPGSWLTIANHSHRPRWRASILDAAGSPLVPSLNVTGGQIIREEGTSPRVSANVDVPADPQWRVLDQAYLPTGGRLAIEFSITDDGTGTWVTMADLDIAATALARPEDVWTIAAVDRSARIALDDLIRGHVPQFGGSTVADVIAAIVHRTFPADPVTAVGPALTQLVPDKYGDEDVEGSPWRLAEALAAEAASEVFYDAGRRVQIRPIPTAGAPRDALAVGPGGTVTGYVVKHELSINTVAALYINSTSGQVMRRGLAEDRRTTSPVAVQRVGSNITTGEVIRADAAPTQAQADAAAAAILSRQGKPRAAEVRHPSRPWLEPGDSVAVTFLGGPTETLVVESVGIDLGPDNIQVTRLRNHDYRMNQEV